MEKLLWQKQQRVMKVTSERPLIICGKMPVARWVRMKNSGQWLLNKCLPVANAQKAPAKKPRRQNQQQPPRKPQKAANKYFTRPETGRVFLFHKVN